MSKHVIDWGDGTIEEVELRESDDPPVLEHTYAKPGDYQVQVTPPFPWMLLRTHCGDDEEE